MSKRGPKPRAIVPTGAQPAAKAARKPAKARTASRAPQGTPAPPIGPQAVQEAMQRELAAAMAKSTKGQRLANHEMRLLRDAWLHDQALHLWPTLVAAAADLSISPATLRSFADQGCPGVEPHSPIPKAPVLAWLLKRAHERGGDRGATSETVEELDRKLKQAKLDTTERRVREIRQEAIDAARSGVQRAMAAVRHRLTATLPPHLVSTVRDEPDRQAAEHAIATLIESALREIPAITSEPS